MEYFTTFNSHLIEKQTIVNLKPLVVKGENAKYLLQKLIRLFKVQKNPKKVL